MADKKKFLLMNDKSDMFFSTWSKRSRETLDAVKKANHHLYALSMFGLGIYSVHVMAKFWRLSEPDVEDDSKAKNKDKN